MKVVVLVVVILAKVGDMGLDRADEDGTEADEVLKVDDVTEDLPGDADVLDDVLDDDVTEFVPAAADDLEVDDEDTDDDPYLVLLLIISANSLRLMVRDR